MKALKLRLAITELPSSPSKTCKPLGQTSVFPSPRSRQRSASRQGSSKRTLFRSASTKTHTPNTCFRQLYEARCSDLNIPVLSDQCSRFLHNCLDVFEQRKLQLPDLGLGELSGEELGRLVHKFPVFSCINLEKNSLGDRGVNSVVKRVVKYQNLVYLNIGSNEMSVEGTKSILEMLENHPSLVSLDISKNRLSGTISLPNFLENNTIITHLNLSGTFISADTLKVLSKGFELNKGLLFLDISNNKIKDSLDTFCKALKDSSLIELVLSQNFVGDLGCSLIAGALSDPNCKLRKLDMSKNDLTVTGTMELFSALRANTALTHLNLSHNYLNQPCDFSKFMGKNSTIGYLNLSKCNLPNSFLCSLGLELSKSSSLSYLNLSSNSITDQTVKYISDGVLQNNSLKVLNLSCNYISVLFM